MPNQVLPLTAHCVKQDLSLLTHHTALWSSYSNDDAVDAFWRLLLAPGPLPSDNPSAGFTPLAAFTDAALYEVSRRRDRGGR
jgi:hypothetical protein